MIFPAALTIETQHHKVVEWTYIILSYDHLMDLLWKHIHRESIKSFKIEFENGVKYSGGLTDLLVYYLTWKAWGHDKFMERIGIQTHKSKESTMESFPSTQYQKTDATTQAAEPSKFWMVLGSGYPTVKHESKEKAVKEAERLASRNDAPFYVLEAVAVVKPKSNTEVIEL